MAFKALLSSASSSSPRKRHDGDRRDGNDARHTPVILSDVDKLAMLDQLERSGISWFWATDASGQLTYLSSAVADRLEIGLDELLGQAMANVFMPAINEARSKPLSLALNTHKAFSNLTVQARHLPDKAVLRLAGQPVFDSANVFAGFRGTGTDITEDHHRDQETERLARFDSLTGLSNRHQMAHLIDTTLAAFKVARRNCAIMMLDLDRFKQVNDTLGHAAGDELLKQVSARLKRAVQRDCEIGRLGGDEFQVMLPDMDDRGELGDIALRIITMLKQPYSLDDGRCVIGASVGIAIAPHDGVSRAEVVRSADLALYAAKNGGRGQHRFYTTDLEMESIFRRRLGENLGAALQDEQLGLRFEPIIDAQSQIVSALEVHICWEHPDRGHIDEEEFATILEGSSQVVDVAKWSIAEACANAARWPESIRIAVNVPDPLFNAEDFVSEVAQALQTTGLPPERLELEISESVFFGDAEQVDRTLGALFKLGVRMTLDEFGSGYSSLAYLRRAPFDTIKIDEKLIGEAAAAQGRELDLIKAIVALAGALNMNTIANGIDTPETLGAISSCGVGFVQGAIFAEPMDKLAVETELGSGSWTLAACANRTRRARRRTVFRKIQVIHDDHSYEVTLRNLSRSGALIQGLSDVPLKTQFVVDLSGGQLAVATVTRSNGDTQGLEFEQELIEDGSGGLCTRNRVSPYALAAAGAPLEALSGGDYKAMPGGNLGRGGSIPQFSYARQPIRETA